MAGGDDTKKINSWICISILRPFANVVSSFREEKQKKDQTNLKCLSYNTIAGKERREWKKKQNESAHITTRYHHDGRKITRKRENKSN